MPDFNTLLNTYFVQAADANLPSEPVPQTFASSRVTPLVDASNYNAELESALALVGTGVTPADNDGHFILIANWWLGLSGGQYVPSSVTPSGFGPAVVDSDPYCLDGPGGTKILRDILIQKAQVGVDVRVLGWISFVLMGSATARIVAPKSYTAINAFTMQGIKDLRASAVGSGAMLNIIAHSAGAVHSKLVVIGNKTQAIGFTGGIDFENGRWAHPMHPDDETWHDVVAKVEGAGVQSLFDWFKSLWDENFIRPVKTFKFEGTDMPHCPVGAKPLPLRVLPTAIPGEPSPKHHIQCLRTVPKFNYAWYNCLPENPPISFGPDGIFEVRTAVRKALRAASSYIYIEDQAFWSQETMDWANDAIKAQPGVKVILLTNGAPDPNDPAFPPGYFSLPMNRHLLKDLTPAQIANQVRLFRRFGDSKTLANLNISAVTPDGADRSRVTTTTNLGADDAIAENQLANGQWMIQQGANAFQIVANPAVKGNTPLLFTVQNLPGGVAPAPGLAPLSFKRGITIHAKTVLVDDNWAMIGSANTMRRSLYTDLEHSVGFMDEGGTVVRDYRAQLWADHFRHPTPADFNDLAASLHAWEPTWGVAGAAPTRPVLLDPIPLPFTPDATLGPFEALKYNNFEDADSRESWGGVCP